MTDIYEFLDGKKDVRHGIEGTYRHKTITGRCHRQIEMLVFIPSARGQQSSEYQRVRDELGDDWETDLTGDIGGLVDTAARFGFPVE